MTNNTTLVGWLKKTNFIKDGKDPIQATIQLGVAHHHASHWLSHEIWEYSQWFCGADNTVANALCSGQWPVQQRTNKNSLLSLPFPASQALQNSTPSQKITSWLTSLLLWLPVKPQLVETHMRMTLRCGTVTSNTMTRPDSGTIFSSMECPDSSGLKSWELFPRLCIKGNFLQQCDASLAESTVANTINAVAATFRENRQNNHKKDAKNSISQLLQWQLRSYKKDDPNKKAQQALPVCVFHVILSSKSIELWQAMGRLAAAATSGPCASQTLIWIGLNWK
jgi:hypothetical protein